MPSLPGYTGRILRVDLSRRKLSEESVAPSVLRQYLGGTGLGSWFLYREVPPGVSWADPENRLILSSGPLGGTRVAGSGTFCVVTKGALTEGATASQANGYFGAYLKLSGYDAVILHGAASDWVYLYIHDGQAELREARHLLGQDTYNTEDLIKAEIDKRERQASVYSIGPAGENLVRFAAIVGDKGHVVAHNGVGAVMGSKKLKAVVAARGEGAVPVADDTKLATLNRELVANIKADPVVSNIYEWGTSFLFSGAAEGGWLPVKNLTTNLFPEHPKFMGQNYRSKLDMKRHPCWNCGAKHCHIVTVREGPYAGYVAEEPEYEVMAAWTSLIGQTDLGAAIMLSDVTDRLGLDGNEAGWLASFALECYERGILTRQDTGGLELTWGNVEAVRALLHQVARREGLGNTLAEGVMRAAQAIGGEALNIGVYIQKGHAPRGHDHRARWTEILDYATSGVGTIETGPARVADRFSPRQVAEAVYRGKTLPFIDSLGICTHSTGTFAAYPDSPRMQIILQMLQAVTGWDFTTEETIDMVRRVANRLRVFNLRHGVSTLLEAPSCRYGSAPVDGPVQGRSIMPHWKEMLDIYYELMGWDRRSGYPLPETLKRLGLEEILSDIS